jgi:thymidylate kinase
MIFSKGFLITFSGLDGAGKSTQINLLMDQLRLDGKNPIYLWTRGGYTPYFEGLKMLLRRLPGKVAPPSGNNPQRTKTLKKRWVRRMWLLLAIFDLIRVLGLMIRWRLWQNRLILCDRYLWDTFIDFKLNFPEENVEDFWLWRLLVRISPQPDAAFLMLVDVKESLRRSDIKGEPFRDTPEVLAQRLACYRTLIQGNHWHVMDGGRPVSELHQEIQMKIIAAGLVLSRAPQKVRRMAA